MFKELEAESQFLQVEIEFLQGQISQEAYEKAKENKGLNKQVKEEGDRRQRAMAAAEAQQWRRRSTESQAKNAREQVPDDDHLDFKKLLGAAKGAVGALRENREKLAMVVGRQINRKLDKRGIIESSYEAPLQGPAGDNRKPTKGSRGVGTKGKRRSSRQRAREKKTRAHEKVLQNKELAKAQGKLEDLKEESLDMHFEVNSIKERMRKLLQKRNLSQALSAVPRCAEHRRCKPRWTRIWWRSNSD
ncbi:unnamed protein product [Polarella glacialis]|uniref:Uncharacterized protein n=1 Tax=Polarella glacialis TaxID=89957 RepID=A0A813K7I4_POLGL|nr:unnamed protein product [Polarella glacialis]